MKKIIATLIMGLLIINPSYAQKSDFGEVELDRKQVEVDEHGNQTITDAKANPKCVSPVMGMVKKVPIAAKVYKEYRNRKDFILWISECDNPNAMLAVISTAVHETVHGLRYKNGKNDYYTVDGDYITAPNDRNFKEPNKLVPKYLGEMKKNHFSSIYMTTASSASSSVEYSTLLDEFNAYIHSVRVMNDGIKYINRKDYVSPERDGLAAFMAYAAIYAYSSMIENKATWKNVKKDPAIKRIWDLAEKEMEVSCNSGINMGTEDSVKFLKLVHGYKKGMEQVLGREIKTFQDCQ